MENALIDTNIVIYLLKNNSSVTSFVKTLSIESFSISIVTWIETLGGSLYHGKTIQELAGYLENFNCIPITETIGITAAQLIQNNALSGAKMRFQDTVIAATALVNNMPLITNNPKDFRRFKGLKTITPN